MIVTANLLLITCELHHYTAVMQGNAVLSNLLNAEVPEKWTESPEMILVAFDRMKNDPSLAPWFFNFIIHQKDNRLIGVGGFKDKPSPEGEVEIGYEIIPSYRDQGYATETARALIDYAFTHDKVSKVIAHTLSEFDASVRVLQKTGMQFIQCVPDKEGGVLCRWEMSRAYYENPSIQV